MQGEIIVGKAIPKNGGPTLSFKLSLENFKRYWGNAEDYTIEILSREKPEDLPPVGSGFGEDGFESEPTFARDRLN